ncbi:xylose isomerase [Caldicellulosiruptor bescii]|uniref:Xylose isomerase n=2 Tax=Caldicellulosiruptor bescii TaxID=31899 RepID=XYLA_CALBD|nr:xylose isomerase [Caldicellulosiruptor bescii]B9MPG8.1 RecName: Full=Xylose isomerase [Caldicellulosiruptor bescii DSM 6725]ACM59729.1 xylose isomerase [Caldicellulosiruptor bescii DSM 6725]PBC87138.1 xylose isomerase [Caldicellulosiruptor bescii]PBC90077.1 xylose isomerase [Caldicellulosiruptor bescii]PBD04492.1 xylose isomerase [Caldicellulosiruptor bescii]PBD05874.1 xylose isomerase [Caldicellulosiruptor bescii]
MKYFKDIPEVKYEGPQSDNPFAFKYYNPDEIIDGKPLKDHLRFAIAYWHTFCATGSDPFGQPTIVRPWDKFSNRMDNAKARVEAAFEFFELLDVPFFCFHDRDIAPEGENLKESNKNLDEIVSLIKEYLKTSKTKVLWGTANLFSHPRYVHGAATSCNADVFAYAAAQVKKALEVTKELGGENYVFWGGREGYETLLNTDMGLELDNLARFLHMAVEYAKEIGFDGQFLIEPKPKEPTKHQYDFDSAHVYGFLKKYDLDKYFKLNIEVNHATLAGHDFHHELRFARINNMLGSIDANMGDLLLGWDTDQFPTDVRLTTLAMYEVIKAGGFDKGGLNFDAKVRRGSFELEDLVIGHIAGMDAFAKGFKIAYKLVKDGVFDKFIDERYKSYKEGIGAKIVSGEANFKMLEEYALSLDKIENKSGKQELLEMILNKYMFSE